MVIEISIIIIMIIALTHLGRKLAPYVGLLDVPEKEARKKHVHVTPVIGGVVVFISYTACLLLFFQDLISIYASLLFGMGACIALGVYDDMKHMRPFVKMFVQIIIAILFATLTDMNIHYLGNMFGMGDLGTRWGALPFTALCIVVLMNAINWIDGLDGLAGGILFSILALLGYVTYGSVITPLIILLIAGVFGFLLMNMRSPWRKKALIFFGDAGSLGLGFALSWVVIYLTQIEIDLILTPMVAVWIISYPIFDMICSLANRIIHKKPLHCADNMHAHYLIQNLGLSIQNSTYALIAISTLYGVIGIVADQLGMPEYGLTALWIVALLAHFITLRWLLSKGA